MMDAETGVRTGSGQTWRAVLEIALFATAATVLLTGPNIAVLGRAVARFPGASISLFRPPSPSQPVPASRTTITPKGSPAQVPAPGVVSSEAASAQPRTQSRPRSRRATAPQPLSADQQSQQPAGASAEVARIQHFYGLMDSGIALYHDGWYGPALARFRRAATVMPGSPYAHLWWGRAAVAAGRPDEAREPLERAIALARGSEVARKALLLLQQLNGTH